MNEWIKIDYKKGVGFPPGINVADDELVLITDGVLVGTADYCMDCWERVEWYSPPWPEDNEKYRRTYLLIEPTMITHWMPLPSIEHLNDET